jgi:hypothetical protein
MINSEIVGISLDRDSMRPPILQRGPCKNSLHIGLGRLRDPHRARQRMQLEILALHNIHHKERLPNSRPQAMSLALSKECLLHQKINCFSQAQVPILYHLNINNLDLLWVLNSKTRKSPTTQVLANMKEMQAK